ncbi:hypothetical protein KP509_04G075600 [Ceratopteris richardii]|uniref:Uncharacterized protein n=1 Tax=Ceratopteris richardii TaxID=49495 RepID=A0A8T2V1Y1_CERRI|nr:hypothetical protein KP509_04G075600 [Ceratopteris richardii]
MVFILCCHYVLIFSAHCVDIGCLVFRALIMVTLCRKLTCYLLVECENLNVLCGSRHLWNAKTLTCYVVPGAIPWRGVSSSTPVICSLLALWPCSIIIVAPPTMALQDAL